MVEMVQNGPKKFFYCFVLRIEWFWVKSKKKIFFRIFGFFKKFSKCQEWVEMVEMVQNGPKNIFYDFFLRIEWFWVKSKKKIFFRFSDFRGHFFGYFLALFGLLEQNWEFSGTYGLRQVLDNIEFYLFTENLTNLMIQTRENGRKPQKKTGLI